MSLQIDDNPEEHRYEALLDGKLVGFIQYRLHDGRMTMVHTEVEPAYEGQGVGSELAKVALEDVRDRGLKVVPRCPFIARLRAAPRPTSTSTLSRNHCAGM